jgi:uncharacterized membrane protein
LDSDKKWILALIGLLFFILLSALSPILGLPNWFSDFSHSWLLTICHSNPNRSFTLWGHSMILCSRCTGIYFSLTLGLIISFFISFPYQLRNKRLLFLGISFVFMVIDVVFDWLGIWSNSIVSRFLTGLLVGFSLSIFFFKTSIKNGEHVNGTKT